MGYLNNPKATSETFDSDGRLHTDDQGFVDDEGLLTSTDRIKEMIKVKGIGVAPAELEDLLLGHPKVEDVAFLGLQDEYFGEKPKAYVVLKKGVQRGSGVEKELIRYVKEREVRHKWRRSRKVEVGRFGGGCCGIKVRDWGRSRRSRTR